MFVRDIRVLDGFTQEALTEARVDYGKGQCDDVGRFADDTIRER